MGTKMRKVRKPLLKATLAGAVLMSLGACEHAADIQTPPVDPTYKAAAKGLTANHINSVPVRSFVKEESTRKEVIGAPCTLNSQFYKASVVTPAYVRLPSYADKTPTVELSCTYDGKTVYKSVQPYNKTVQSRTSNAGGGLLTYIIVAAATNKENSVYSYSDLSITFE